MLNVGLLRAAAVLWLTFLDTQKSQFLRISMVGYGISPSRSLLPKDGGSWLNLGEKVDVASYAWPKLLIVDCCRSRANPGGAAVIPAVGTEEGGGTGHETKIRRGK